jgi:hypothetical protein
MPMGYAFGLRDGETITMNKSDGRVSVRGLATPICTAIDHLPMP